ncbi:hypothetical protein K490DRAFT_74437 [Saccharata proteae CBS 121410]|uniref:Protein transport protein Sec61 subunit beta n=1 Tax=Saccharata proteae CBS 121410 TaxID=1314787 RepID=A0A9P4HR99_9PEZI|nr:hypothetical protein K490DRAFT_74437 [Saccharata proteae CBS 121410]
MSYYNDAAWSASGRQPSWEAPAPPSRSGMSAIADAPAPPSSVMNPLLSAPSSKVDRAIDNLLKSGKMGFGGVPGGPGRRESLPPTMGARQTPYADFDPRMAGAQRHHSVSDYDGIRSHSASNLQGFYANQRFAPRPNDADQMMQAKRRMAAQRERELRNYHQEQQYNRNVSGAKSDRSMSPNAMSEEERRELIARQHRALYGNDSNLYADGTTRRSSQDVRVGAATTLAGRGNSPLAFDPFGNMQGSAGDSGAVQMPPRDHMAGKDAQSGAQRSRANSTSSPASNPTTSFSLFDNAQQSSRTSNSSPTGASPPRQGGVKSAGPSGVAPIGTRPAQPAQVTNAKRSTTPLPSPLSYGFSAADAANAERSTSAASNPTSSVTDKPHQNRPWRGSSNSSSPRPTSPVNSPPTTGSTTARPSSPKPPGGPATAIRRKAAADRADKVANARPSSTRAAGAGGSSSTMLRLYTDESPGLKVDPVVVLVLSVGFIISVVALHVIAKITKKFSA